MLQNFGGKELSIKMVKLFVNLGEKYIFTFKQFSLKVVLKKKLKSNFRTETKDWLFIV